jgi:electron transfer flavoprotein alpha subunit
MKGNLATVVIGSGIETVANELKKYGADKIILVDDPTLSEYMTDSYTNVLADIITKEKPDVLILGASAQGKDLSARLSARLNAPLRWWCGNPGRQ